MGWIRGTLHGENKKIPKASQHKTLKINSRDKKLDLQGIILKSILIRMYTIGLNSSDSGERTRQDPVKSQ
jgi:hypothetical protein